MSFLTDLFEGKTNNLGNDLAPSNIFSDAGTDIAKNPLLDAGLLVGGTLLTAGLADPALLGLGAAGGLGDLLGGGAAAAADAGAVDAGVGAGGSALDALVGGGGDVAAAGGGGIDALASIGPGASADVAGAPISLAAPGASAAAPASGGFWNSILTGAESSLAKNPLGIAAAAGGLGLDVLKGNKQDPNQSVLAAQAPALAAQGAQITAQAQQLQTYLTSGTLPPALQSQVSSAVAAEKARIISNHAANGENTNPSQNSALAQELSQADINGINLAGQMEQQLFQSGTQLLQTGLNETGLSTQLYETLAKMDSANNTQFMSAIAAMAAALGGGSKVAGSPGGVSISL